MTKGAVSRVAIYNRGLKGEGGGGQGRYAQMDGWGKFAGFFFQMRRDGIFRQSNRLAAGGVK